MIFQPARSAILTAETSHRNPATLYRTIFFCDSAREFEAKDTPSDTLWIHFSHDRQNGLATQPGPRINAAFGELMQAYNQGASSYNSLQASLNHKFASNVTGQFTYTYSHCIDNGSFASSLEEWAQLQTDRYNTSYDYENCNFDLRHNISPGPGTVSADISITKETKLTEKLNMEFRAEMFNFINDFNPGGASPNSAGVLGAIGEPNAGLTSYSQAPVVTPRQVQFALKFDF